MEGLQIQCVAHLMGLSVESQATISILKYDTSGDKGAGGGLLGWNQHLNGR
jgi:hypothetical protein